jgi:uncharacterized Zn finger protein
VTDTSCTCPDHARRGALVTCKHRVAVAEHIRGLVQQMEARRAAATVPAPLPGFTAEKEAATRKMISELWPAD